MEGNTAKELIKRFLRAMEARDLESAQAMMAPGAEIIFPGGVVFQSQAEMVAAAQGRYQWVKKTFDRLESLGRGDQTVVFVMGTLSGVNIHGVAFSGIRYIDRFALENGLITSQEVWNDLAESGVLEIKTGSLRSHDSS